MQELLEMLAEAEAQDDIDEEAIADLLATTEKLSDKQRAKAQFISIRIRFRIWWFGVQGGSYNNEANNRWTILAMKT